jgi:hypothetical protein
MKSFKIKKATHISESSCFATSSWDWFGSNWWCDVDNYKERVKYECCNDSRYCGEELWAWSLLSEG